MAARPPKNLQYGSFETGEGGCMNEPSLDSTDVITEVIRPAAIVPEAAARKILRYMSVINIFTGGLWQAEVRYWIRYDRPG